MDVPDRIMRDFLSIAFVCARTIGFRVEDESNRRTSLARDKWLIMVASGGSLNLKTPTWQLFIDEGEIALIPPCRYFWLTASNKSVRVLRLPMLCVNAKHLPGNPLDRLSLPMSIPHRNPIRLNQILEQINAITDDEARARTRGDRLLCNAYLNELLSEFLVAGFEANLFSHWHQVVPDWLQSARTIIENRRRDAGFTIAELSDQLGVSEGHLYRSFKKAFQKTPRQYLIEYRMEIACQLLTTRREYTIDVIMKQVGYMAPSEFISAFKKYTGKHPHEFRASLD